MRYPRHGRARFGTGKRGPGENIRPVPRLKRQKIIKTDLSPLGSQRPLTIVIDT